MDGNYSLADIAAATGGYDGGRNSGMFGGDGAWWIIILFLFMWGRGGFGNDGYGSGSPGLQGLATRADINEGFALNNLQGGQRDIQQGISGLDKMLCQLSAQVMQCCCDTRAEIAGVKYQMASDTCDIKSAIYNGTRDVIENANNNTRSILDFLVQDKISTLQAENQSLRLAASQANQNAVLMAAMDANTAQIIRRTGNDCPIPAYVVQPPSPVTFPQNHCGCGQTAAYGYAS